MKSETISNVENANFQNNNRHTRSLKNEYRTAPETAQKAKAQAIEKAKQLAADF